MRPSRGNYPSVSLSIPSMTVKMFPKDAGPSALPLPRTASWAACLWLFWEPTAALARLART